MKRKIDQIKKNEIEEYLIKNSKKSPEEIMEEYQSNMEGLNEVEAEERLEKYGRNLIDIEKENKRYKRIIEAIVNPFNIVLLIVAFVDFITDVVLAASPDYLTVILILLTVFISVVISFVQQEKSDKAAKKLKKMISNKIDVIRNGNSVVIDIEEVVPGDIVKLSAGDMLPGDVRFLEVKDLFIDQSSLTGESNPVEKKRISKEDSEVTALDNIGFMGTNIVSGTAKAVVLFTGNNTYFGSMAKKLSTNQPEKNSFEQGINSVSKLLIKFMVVMLPIIFIVNLFTKSNILDALLFGVTIVVGLTPEMLPVIVTSTLATGAVAMSKKKTIVKRLPSIQTFGQMDILCTDKTGTLTEDKIVLEKYMDAFGNPSKRILKHCFMNSYYQTGLKNLMDEAIITRADKEGLEFLKSKYIREDEIPFDFNRKRMSVVLRDETGKRQMVTKGAAQEILGICSYIEMDGKVTEFTEELKEKSKRVYEKANKEGLRVIAVAQKNEIAGIDLFSVEDEKEMVLLGYVAFLDPPKESAKTAIDTLKKYGVKVIVLTGDNEGVAKNVCEKLEIETKGALTGKQIEEMSEEELKVACESCYLFSRLSPFQKEKIIKQLQENGHTVGYMGDGINDSLALRQSDVGISVDSAVDIAKETADIILLEKDLNVLEEGVLGGRKTFTNIIKYVKMATSGNFGNMLSVVIASIFLPFLPLLPIHILIQNLLCDMAQLGMPFDRVEEENLIKPKKWDVKSITRYMFSFGIISTILDVLCFLVLWFVFEYNTIEQQAYFQTGWFVFGIVSQTLIIYMIRTSKFPFVQNIPSKHLVFSTSVVTIIALILGFTSLALGFDLVKLPIQYLGWLIVLLLVYAISIQLAKKQYIKVNKEWL